MARIKSELENGIRPYGPGKFHNIIDSYVYELTLNGGADEEVSLGDGNGWYGFMHLSPAAKSEINAVAAEQDDELTDEETDLLSESVAVILFERSDGIVGADWFDDLKKAEADWAEIEAGADEEDEDDEGEEEEDDDFDLESEMEDALVIVDSKRGYSVSFSGKHVGDFSDFDEALAAGVLEMHSSQYFPNVFYVNERGNTDLLTVKYELQGGRPINIESTTVRSWV